MEQWRPVAGYEGLYEVSDLGRVRSLDRYAHGQLYPGKLLRLRRLNNQTGHLYVSLSRKGVVKAKLVHRLVLEAYVGFCPRGMEGLHRRDNPDDNRLVNLRWGTRTENLLDSVRNGRHNRRRRMRKAAINAAS